MSTINLQWIGHEQFIGTDSGNHSVVISTDKNRIGCKPTELVLIALASCIAVTLVMMLNKRDPQIKALEIEVNGERKSDHPRAFTHIHLHFKISGRDLTVSELERALWLSEHKYCPVAAAIRDTTSITTSYDLAPS